MSDGERTCPDCGRVVTIELWRARKWGKACNPCLKRKTRQTGAWAERDRETSRRWKREHLGQPGQPRKAS